MENRLPIKDLARLVAEEARGRGYVKITPKEDTIRVTGNNDGIHSVDFIIEKENGAKGKVSIVVRSAEEDTQTVVQLSRIVIE